MMVGHMKRCKQWRGGEGVERDGDTGRNGPGNDTSCGKTIYPEYTRRTTWYREEGVEQKRSRRSHFHAFLRFNVCLTGRVLDHRR